MNKLKIILVLHLLISPYLFAQIINVNDIRNFKIDENTIIKKDGIVFNNLPIDIIGTGGFKIRFSLNQKNSNQTISQGTLAEINLISDIKGPVTSVNPLTILDQAVFTTADTVLEDKSDVNMLIVGDLVSVSGSINQVDNSMQLSRLELEQSLSEWKLRGFARNINATSFTIGNLSVNINGVIASDCPNGFIDDTFVEIKATTDASYSTGNALATLTNIQCQSADIDEGSVGVIPTVIEGIISNITDLSSFKINDLTIFFDTNTGFDNGESEHLDEGTKVEVQGFIDTNTQFVTATTIRFINHRIKMVAPIYPSDITLNQSITLFGKTIHITPQTRDEDNIISSGLTSLRQVEVRGFRDSDGNIFAQRVKDKGSPDADDTKLRGDLTNINQPFVNINGILVDLSNSQFELEENIATLSEFFAILELNMQVTIEGASYDETTQILSLGEIELTEQETEDDPDHSTNKTTRDIIGTGGVGIATITGSEVIFNSTFE